MGGIKQPVSDRCRCGCWSFEWRNRLTDAANYMYLVINSSGTSYSVQVTGGVETNLVSQPLGTITLHQGAEVKLILNGSTVSCYYDGVFKNTYRWIVIGFLGR